MLVKSATRFSAALIVALGLSCPLHCRLPLRARRRLGLVILQLAIVLIKAGRSVWDRWRCQLELRIGRSYKDPCYNQREPQ